MKKIIVLFILLLNATLHAGENIWEPTSLYGRCCRNFVFDPSRPSVVFGYNPNEIYRSTSSGKSWKRIPFPFEQTDSGEIVLRISGANPAKIFVLSKQQFLRSTDDGRTWLKVGEIPTLKSVFDLAIDSQNPNIIYASGAITPRKAFQPAVFRSTDQGKNWKLILTGSTGRTMHVEVHPLKDGIVYARDSRHIFKSTDSGDTWNQNDSIPKGAAAFIIDPMTGDRLYTAARDVFKSTDDGNSWNGLSTHLYTTSIAIDRNNPDTIYAAGLSDLLKSANGGESWSILKLAPLLNGYAPWTVAVNPQRSNLVLAWNLHSSSFRSLDAGNTFELITAGGAGGIQKILPFKKKPSKLLVVGNALFQTNDFGKTWKTTTITIPEAEAVSVEDIQLHPSNENLVVAVVLNATRTNSSFLYYLAKSLDGGDNWNLLPIDEENINDMALHPVDTNTIYLALSRKALKSTDAGTTWNRIDETLPRKRFDSIEVDPFNANRLLLTAEGPSIYRSVDGGRSWKTSDQGILKDRTIELSIQFDLFRPNVVFAFNYGSIYKSTNGGQTWSRSGTGLILNRSKGDGLSSFSTHPRQRDVFFVTTFENWSHPELFISKNGGALWEPFTNNGLDTTQVFGVAQIVVSPDSNRYFLGTDDGLYTMTPK